MIDALAWLLVAVTALPVLMFAAEVLAGAAPHRETDTTVAPPPFAVLVPAHNEAAGITTTITTTRLQLRGCDRLIVIADNCDDGTAAIARAAGAEVIERFSATERGKGFALAAGRSFLAQAAPAAVIVVDADCHPEPGALQRLAAHAVGAQAAVQGRNLLSSNGDSHPLAQISLFAFVIKNLVRQRGLQRLGAPALLQGTGMALAWPLFARARLASGCLAEDLELGLGLVLENQPVLFLPGAGFHSPASSRDATIGQRTRWEHGAILTGWRHVPRLLAASFRRPNLLLLALDLLIPPLALLGMTLGLATLATGLLVAIGADPLPLLLQLGLGLLFALAIAHAWHRSGRAYLSFSALLQVPAYMLWKLPIYTRLLVDRQRQWVRTSRDA
jgi:cellulose synthase/poly-beta-1,6-N-acetylglucosamine synthase-like glycosyltransferase